MSISLPTPILIRVTTVLIFDRLWLLYRIFTKQRDKDRRAKSVIVNGLSPSDVISDLDNFRQLCVSELSINPQVSSTRRLGRGISSDGRATPLLVNLGSKEEANDIIEMLNHY